MPEFICGQCGKREFHENEDTLKMMVKIHGEFCRKKDGEDHSFMHRDDEHNDLWILKEQAMRRMYLYSKNRIGLFYRQKDISQIVIISENIIDILGEVTKSPLYPIGFLFM